MARQDGVIHPLAKRTSAYATATADSSFGEEDIRLRQGYCGFVLRRRGQRFAGRELYGGRS